MTTNKATRFTKGFGTCMTLPTYTISIKLLGKLTQVDEVERLWGELVELDCVGPVEAQARIDAAADNGDIQGAAQILNFMGRKRIELDVVHFTSAINACANSHHPFETMLAKGIVPDVVTYGSLLRTLKDESPQCGMQTWRATI